MAILQDWQKIAYNENASQGELQKFWQRYFLLEKGVYEKLLTNPDEKVEGTVKELADKYGLTILEMAGFLDGINDSLVKDNPIETMDENTRVNLVFDKMPRLTGFTIFRCGMIFLIKRQSTDCIWNRKNPVRLSLAKRWDVMIRVHAAVERNTNSAVERINKFQILKKKFPVSQKLIPGFFKKKNRNRIRPCGLVHTDVAAMI